MAISSDLAAVFSLIQQQQALEERKEERSQDLALQLLSFDMAEDRFNLQMQSNLLDKKRTTEKVTDYYGSFYTSQEILNEIKNFKFNYVFLSKEKLYEKIAFLIFSNKIKKFKEFEKEFVKYLNLIK
mgnify:CR=1 FL=1